MQRFWVCAGRLGDRSGKTEDLGTTRPNSYLAGRIKRNILRTSYVGAIVTDRESPVSGDYNRVYGPDVHLQLYDKIEVDSYMLRSETPGRTDRNLGQERPGRLAR